MTQEPKIFPYIARLLQGAEVVWKPLGEVAEYEQPTKYLVKSSNYKDIYLTPVLTAGKTFILGYTDETEGIYKASISPVIIFDDFTTANKWVDFDFKAKSSAMKMITSKNEKEVLLKYIYYWLNTLPSELIEGDHKRQWISNYANKKIPLPPLSVQQEIVRILDKFTTLEAELEAELDCRKRQYDYYRNHLLSYEESEVVWKTLGEVFNLKNGYTPSKANKEYWENGTIPWFRMEDIRANGRVLNDAIQKVSKSAVKGGKLFPANSIMLSTTATIGEHALIQVDYLSNQQLTNFSLTEDFSHQVDIKYVFHYFFLINEELKRIGSDATLQIIGIKKLEKIKIPIPPLEEQQRIASILDKFDTLVNSISEGLPREIELRKKQYEYYREQLLSFPSSLRAEGEAPRQNKTDALP